MASAYHILLIEDDTAVARALQDGLEREGYRITWRNTAAGGVACASEALPGLVILDLRLPDGSGLDACRQMRSMGLHMPILMLTVQREELDRVLGLEIGADDYMVKPFSLRELLSRIRALLRRAYGEYAAGQGDLILVRDLVIDPARGQVRRGDQILNLTPTEFRLLLYLARHPGLALSRTQIIEDVWGYTQDLDSDRTVNVHIRRLREKVELDPARPTLILTVPGIGYRFIL
jgi:DNA-binding response OmpR family regulator